MSIEYERYIQTQTNFEIKKINDLTFNQLTDLFGNYLTWNELNQYNNYETIDIQVASKIFDDNKCVLTIWFNKKFIKDIEFKNFGSELIYKLDQMEI